MKKTLEEIAKDLEGKHIVFAYRECDDETEDCGISIYKMKDSKLEKIFDPGTQYDPGRYQACCYDEELKRYVSVDELAIRKLKELGVNEVYAVNFTENFFGISEEFCTINPQSGCEEGCFNWGWYRHLADEGKELVSILTDNEIKVINYDAN